MKTVLREKLKLPVLTLKTLVGEIDGFVVNSVNHLGLAPGSHSR